MFENFLSFVVVNKELFIFILFLSIFLFLKRDSVQFQGSFLLYMLLYKSTWGIEKMKLWAKKYPRLFLNLAYLSYFIGVVGIFLSLFLMIWSLQIVFDNDLSSGGGLVLPLKTDSGLDGAVPIFYVPFWYWIIALFVLAIVHEFAHGVIAKRFKIPIKSSGFAFLGIIFPILPAAFVEPDEKKLGKAKKWHQISVLGAGSTSNFLFGFFFLFLWIFVAVPFFQETNNPTQISFDSVLNESDLANYNISSGRIFSINNITDPNEQFVFLSNLSINQSLNITISRILNDSGEEVLETFTINTYENPTRPGKGMVGISGLRSEMKLKDEYSYLGSLPRHFERVLYYLWMLNIGIGIMNLLPLWITDGGKISKIVFTSIFRRKRVGELTNTFVNWLSLILIIVTLYPKLLFGLF